MERPAVTLYLTKVPFDFLVWWFWEAPITLIKILRFIFAAIAHLLSFQSLFSTFFKPWKNEYREGLVRTAIFIGAFIKLFLILFDSLLFVVLLSFEAIIFIAWVALPFIAIIALYGAIFA